MQTAKEHISTPLDIQWRSEYLIINEKPYQQTVLITPTWEILVLPLTSLKEWAQHQLRKSCPQIITKKETKSLPTETIDAFWSENVGIELLQLAPAQRQASLMIQDRLPFQWLILSQGTDVS